MDTRVAHISGVARPSPRLRRMAAVLHGSRMANAIESMVEDTKAVDALAALLDRAMTTHVTKDGRLDLREVALFVIREMRSHQL